MNLKIAVALWVIATGLWSPAGASAQVAFVDVHVVPMDRDRVLDHQTVVVKGGAIASLGPVGSVAVPAGAQEISGHGTAYLLPGLADMHTHVTWTEDLALYTANGVTTLLQLGGAQPGFISRVHAEVDSGQVVGPRVFFSLLVDDPPELNWAAFRVSTPAQTRATVRVARSDGYDFIKVYNSLTAPVFAALVEAARQNGLAVIGHGVRSVGLPKALFAGQVMVAHAEEFYYTAFANQLNEALLPEVVDATYRSGAYVTPNLSAFEFITRQWGRREAVQAFLADPRAEYMTPDLRYDWSLAPYADRQGDIGPMYAFLKKLTKAFADKGVPLLTGTDSPAIPGLLAGYSIHDDLRTLLEAGLTPYAALSAATRVPGEFIAKYVPTAERAGQVKTGQRADLVLVSDNPLESLKTLEHPLGVMSAGRWMTDRDLKALLERQKDAYKAALK